MSQIDQNYHRLSYDGVNILPKAEQLLDDVDYIWVPSVAQTSLPAHNIDKQTFCYQ